jgi:DNA gyrase subunit A
VIVSNLGTTIRIDAESVSRQGRSAQGVRVMNLRTGDSVSAIAKVVSSRGAVEDAGGDELSLDEIVKDPDAPASVTPDGEVILG